MNKCPCGPHLRHSRQRQAILDHLRASHSHPTAAAIYDRLRPRLPRLSLGTVYRNLEILRGQGLVRVLGGNGREARYDGRPVPHGHFCCRICGRITDLPLSGTLLRDLPALVGRSGKPEDVRLEVTGTCRRCQR